MPIQHLSEVEFQTALGEMAEAEEVAAQYASSDISPKPPPHATGGSLADGHLIESMCRCGYRYLPYPEIKRTVLLFVEDH